MPATDLRSFRSLLRRLVRRLGEEEAQGGCCCGLSFAQCHALLEIGESGESTVVELAEALGLDKSTLSRTVESLVEPGLVERHEHPRDRRYKKLLLTKRGQAVLDEINALADRRFGAVLEGIPKRERAPLMAQLELLVRSLERIGDDSE